MKHLAIGLSVLAAFISLPAHAGDQLELAKQKQCLSCHSVDADRVGPSFKSIAQRFKGLKNAQWMLEDAVLKGSDGVPIHWGVARMPSSNAREPLSRFEATLLVQWILAME